MTNQTEIIVERRKPNAGGRGVVVAKFDSAREAVKFSVKMDEGRKPSDPMHIVKFVEVK